MNHNEMSVSEIEVFQRTSNYVEMRLATPGVATRTRGMERAVVDALVTRVDEEYRPDPMYGAKVLGELGTGLFSFLDGDERWLTDLLTDPRGTTLRITAEERLRHLPWELLATDAGFVTVAGAGAVLPVRPASTIAALGDNPVAAHRPLRVLFMATSPEGVKPELGFEAEEASLLKATENAGLDLVVEESGTLDGLRSMIDAYGNDYFDVLHLSGHATSGAGGPAFVVEDETGGRADATADDLTRALAGRWPRLVFVSGCLTGAAPDSGVVPSMSESLVKAGAPAVLGWALPVGDLSATVFAAELYRCLAGGARLDQAVVDARRDLYRKKSPDWHLLRVYADRSPLAAMVTAPNAPGRARPTVRRASEYFLDPGTNKTRVAPRELFVGRRRVIQRCLRILKQPSGSAEGLVLQGMGGLGKSTLASRLLERMPTHQRVVWTGRVDDVSVRELTDKVAFPTPEQQIDAIKLLQEEQLDFAARFRFLLTRALATTPCVFVFDDFERNLEERDGGHVLLPDAARILPALLSAIRDTGSASRVIVTSRYAFRGTTLPVVALESLTELEQRKKIGNLAHLRSDARAVDVEVRQRAIAVAGGNPRLLDWLDKVVAAPGLDVPDILAAIEARADEFREDVLAAKLLEALPPEARTMLARVAVVNLPVPEQTVLDLHQHADAAAHIRRAADLGLLEKGTAPDGSHRYFVAHVLRPLVPMEGEEYVEACAAAAQSLYTNWGLRHE